MTFQHSWGQQRGKNEDEVRLKYKRRNMFGSGVHHSFTVTFTDLLRFRAVLILLRLLVTVPVLC